jgi:small conductance mechanosensitive channel
MKVTDRLLEQVGNPATLIGALCYAMVFILLAWIVARSFSLALARVEMRILDRTTTRFLRHMGFSLIWLLTFILYAHLIPELRSLGTALLAGASVASILIGIAAQSTLGNVVAGFSLLLYRPFEIGDFIRLTVAPGVEKAGTVEDLTLGYTLIRTPDKKQIIVPNSVMVTQAIIKEPSSEVA